MSRGAQLKMLSALDAGSGEWKAVEVSAAGQLEPALSLSATVWTTERGMYWRADDAYALARYHNWVANHLIVPTPAVHGQRLILANPTQRGDRHIEIKQWTGRRALWLDALRMNRVDGSTCADSGSPEHTAGLVHVPYEQLSTAGLHLTARHTRTDER
jgi:hypothetical protein